MKLKKYYFALLLTPCVAGAQALRPATDASLINLQTPSLLDKDKAGVSVDLRYFGGYDKTLNGSVWAGFGICKDLEVDFAGTFSKWSSTFTDGGTEIRFGGTDQELSLRYRLPFMLPVTVQAGLADAQTPAQVSRLSSTVGVSVGYSPDSHVRFYLNPKAVFLQDNSIFGVAVGFSVDIVPKVTVIGDWTPIFAGDNTIDSQTGLSTRGQIYSIGLRFPDLFLNGTLDLGVTNGSGITTGSSLTPSIGEAPGIFARLSYRF